MEQAGATSVGAGEGNPRRVLVTGGAGFIGRRLVARLAEAGDRVLVVDSLLEQVHGPEAAFPEVGGDVEWVRGDVRDRSLLTQAVGDGVDVVYHLAAGTGVGQSMYQIEEYVDVNCRGTAVLLEVLSQASSRPPRVVLSSSRAVYGEGHLRCSGCGLDFWPPARPADRLDRHQWDHTCPRCGSGSDPVPTVETSPMQPTSVYGMTKVAQEQLWDIVGRAYDMPAVVLRYYNVYGPGQAPNNPYTGVLSIFSRRLLGGLELEVYEDGREMRDFVYVDDVVQANLLAGRGDGRGVFNVCSGEPASIYEVARILAELTGRSEKALRINGKYRVGDIRHAVGSAERARGVLGYRPRFTLRQGLRELVEWFSGLDVVAPTDLDRRAQQELLSRGLYR